MSNLALRTISGVVMGLMVIGCLMAGKSFASAAVILVGFFVVDEVITKFFSHKRLSWSYLSSLSFYLIAISLGMKIESLRVVFIYMSLGLNVWLLYFLFLGNKSNSFSLERYKPYSSLWGFLLSLPILSLIYIFDYDQWKVLIIGLLLMNFIVDIAAYFCGRFFGRHKLWESVSPKKTVEGAVGGVAFSVLASYIYWNSYLISPTTLMVVFFLLAAVSAQLGDLVQSKFKRLFLIKDSSSLIPGHGGVYDRVDSLLFVAPFYIYFLTSVVY